MILNYNINLMASSIKINIVILKNVSFSTRKQKSNKLKRTHLTKKIIIAIIPFSFQMLCWPISKTAFLDISKIHSHHMRRMAHP